MAVLTFFVCGFVVVFVLGSKGYCSYGCPYGAAFGLADRLAPIRVRVTDACEGCATCTAVCTSNVRVHEEVRDHGAVVDPGCMKCLDCVANCPNQALYVGAGRPAVAAGGGRSKTGAVGWSEEVLAGLAFVLGFVAFRGLYGIVPFLLSLGLAAIFAGLVVVLRRVIRERDAWLGSIRLKSGGHLRRSGWIFVIAMVPVVTFWGHCVVVQGLTRQSDRLFHRTEDLRREALEINQVRAPLAAEDQRLVSDARQNLDWSMSWSLVDPPGAEFKMAWLAFLDGDSTEAGMRIDRALMERPADAQAHLLAGRILVIDQRWPEAVAAYARVIELEPARSVGYLGLGTVLGSSGRIQDALLVFRRGSGRCSVLGRSELQRRAVPCAPG